MPAPGNSMFGVYPDLAKDQQNVLLNGINLFQLIYPKRVYSDIQIHGPFNVKVLERDIDVSNRSGPLSRRFKVNWQIKGDAHIDFEYDRQNKIGIAWMPDDPYWHNRVILMDTTWLLRSVTQLRLPDNSIKSGAEVALEVKCLESVLKHDIDVFHLIEDGRVRLGSFRSKKEAVDYKDDQVAMVPQIKSDGTIAAVKRRKAAYEIQQGTDREYRPEIISMINQEMPRHEFGWTQCSKFQEELKPQVIDLIKQERSKATAIPAVQAGPKLSLADVARIFAGMTTEEKAFIAESMRGSTPQEAEEDEVAA